MREFHASEADYRFGLPTASETKSFRSVNESYYIELNISNYFCCDDEIDNYI